MLNSTQQFKTIMRTYGKRINVKLVFGDTTIDKAKVCEVERDTNGELFTSIMNMFTVEVSKYDIDEERPDNIAEATSVQVFFGAKINEDD